MGRRWSWLATLALASSVGAGWPQEAGTADGHPNVLLIVVDDLGTQLGCYGNARVHTPAIDALARGGLVFRRAYCPRSTCAAARASLLSGMRPETHGVRDLRQHYRDRLPEVVSLPELFRSHGWFTWALGKLEHGRGEREDERAWSRAAWRPPGWQRWYAEPEHRARVAQLESGAHVFAWEAPDVGDEELPDGRIAAEAEAFLRAAPREPFFLGVGFLKPHLPFVAPRRYWDLYPEAPLDLLGRREPPAGAARGHVHDSDELRDFLDAPDEGPLGAELERELVRGYAACTSFVDAQIAKLLTALEDSGLAERTVVVLMGDHGFQAGEFGLWGKHTLFESALRFPLIVRAPGVTPSGAACDRLVETTDLLPTLAELCALPPPAGLEGTSFVPLLHAPELPWKSAAFSTAEGSVPGVGLCNVSSVRTERWRYSEWAGPDGEYRATELYDLEGSVEERANLAGRAELEETERELAALLHAGWRAAAPSGPRAR